MLVLSALLYWLNGKSWVVFGLLFLAPDLSMYGYVVGALVGAGVYNAVHTYALPAVLAAYVLLGGSTVAASVALIWLAHISIDRMLGYGLKYSGGFKDTHLGRL